MQSAQSDLQAQLWKQKGDTATALCEQSKNSLIAGDAATAADYAVQAWGQGIMNGTVCCTMTTPPFCLDSAISGSTLAVYALFGWLTLMFLGSMIASCVVRTREGRVEEEETVAALPPGSPLAGAGGASGELGRRLLSHWMDSHCLRVLPGAKQFAEATSSLFGALHERFDFQQDNVHNQFDHLLSLWRSHCSNVADREVQEGVRVDESKLLYEAIGDMHAELLEGFTLWRSKFADSDGSGFPEREDHEKPPLGDIKWTPLTASTCGSEVSAAVAMKQLAEIATYLLVWGEGGNVRFMPEVLYFIVELALASTGSALELYGGAPRVSAYRSGEPFRSSCFLAKIIRPIYKVVFDEWYQEVTVAKNGKDSKQLRKGYEAFLPPDVANYDDWDEFFCDPARLAEGLKLKNGKKFFNESHGARFSSLHEVDWAQSLNRWQTKTHREVHSLWGVFATTHRIWLVHGILFFTGVCIVAGDPPQAAYGKLLMGGNSTPERFATIGLLVPFHAILWSFARYHTTGSGIRRRLIGGQCVLATLGRYALWFGPVLTYSLLRYLTFKGDFNVTIGAVLMLHFFVSGAGFISHLGFSDRHYDVLFPATTVPRNLHIIRYAFWFCVLGLKFLLGLTIFRAVYVQCEELQLVMLGHQSWTEIRLAHHSAAWGSGALEWMLLWFTTFFLFCGCTVLGVGTALVQRSCEVVGFCTEDAVSKIPERYSKRLLSFAFEQAPGHEMASAFPVIWDRIIEYMRYEDKINSKTMASQSFIHRDGSRAIQWDMLSEPVKPEPQRVNIPKMFNHKNIVEIGLSHYCCVPDKDWVKNPEIQWRFMALSRGLGLPIPSPFRVPYIPTLSVCIPHYSEDILLTKASLYKKSPDGTVSFIDWLQERYSDEWDAFTEQMIRKSTEDWNKGNEWELYSGTQWEKICVWASMRMQTLWRTVAGMMLYYRALQCHYEIQGDRSSALGRPDIWNPADCFTCLVSMQIYKFFNATQLAHTNKMFKKFPSSLKVAFIDHEDKNINADADLMHRRQARRYFSCLIDGSCKDNGDRKEPRYRIELPGFPILGDGKGDNQNHAIPFMRGTICQCIDMNQGAYFEQMMMLPCVLGEFRTAARGHSGAKRIVGFPEHITSDIGTVGELAAGSEVAFGTLLQRSYAVLGARMHYGHPDMMNKQYMMQQGGVSKATKTLNLSEDIFAGMDFTLRGNERTIRHCEYFHVGKGRDLGFNSVLGFFSKLASGAGEQILTRQMFRLGQVLPLPECFTFYYAHVGYYLTQCFISWAMPIMVFTWSVVLAGDCEKNFRAFETYCPRVPAAQIMAQTLAIWYSWVLVLFLVASSMPLFVEMWMERSFKIACIRFIKQYATCSFLLFVFQAKIIGYYVLNELRYGGATYVATGRGLPTDRRSFIGLPLGDGSWKLREYGGLYLDYAVQAYYDGMNLLGLAILVLLLGGVSDANGHSGSLIFTWVCIGLTVISWLQAPFIFNPYQFRLDSVKSDLTAWVGFFFMDDGKNWVEWYDKMQLQPRQGFVKSVVDINFFLACFALAVWFAIVNHKVTMLSGIYSGYPYMEKLQILSLLPPIGFSLAFCIVLVIVQSIRAASAGKEESSDSEDESAAPAAVIPHARLTDTVVRRRPRAAPSSSDEESSACRPAPKNCPKTIPLASISGVVVVLQVIEAFVPLHVTHGTGWWKVKVAGLFLKLIFFELVLYLAEGTLRSRCANRIPALLKPLDLWVHANRMFRDIFTSAFIFLTLLPYVLINVLNECVLPRFNIHHVLIYRPQAAIRDIMRLTVRCFGSQCWVCCGGYESV
ncbi:unnamed protein product [Polarella glacialis]|uniref:1,3-beta-glucan synthase n=1 Tax=Polarella glacialis TaxID=89957 RepID=A0A813E1N6_POLGL|nr:unnamed protein product [Polarella glacialis]